ncbi:MAG: sigma-70 family RNA polymerase sigma factor [Planctomycetota bacterium]|jgi:RNA polymerase sigma factor for flagellar operon FliA
MAAESQNPQQLIEGCQGLVRSLATKVHRKLPPHLELDDLVAYGQVGLAEAARDFDPTRGFQFSTYAYYRIRGAIYDGVSKMTWLSRSHYHRIRYDQMSNELLRLEAEDSEEAIESDWRWLRDVSRALAVVYLSAHGAGDDDNPNQFALEDPSAQEPPLAAIDRETRQKLHELIDALPSEAGVLVRSVYFEGLTLQEAGERLGVSKSWASRLHAKTLQRLARSLKLMGVVDRPESAAQATAQDASPPDQESG